MIGLSPAGEEKGHSNDKKIFSAKVISRRGIGPKGIDGDGCGGDGVRLPDKAKEAPVGNLVSIWRQKAVFPFLWGVGG